MRNSPWTYQESSHIRNILLFRYTAINAILLKLIWSQTWTKMSAINAIISLTSHMRFQECPRVFLIRSTSRKTIVLLAIPSCLWWKKARQIWIWIWCTRAMHAVSVIMAKKPSLLLSATDVIRWQDSRKSSLMPLLIWLLQYSATIYIQKCLNAAGVILRDLNTKKAVQVWRWIICMKASSVEPAITERSHSTPQTARNAISKLS